MTSVGSHGMGLDVESGRKSLSIFKRCGKSLRPGPRPTQFAKWHFDSFENGALL